MMTTVTMTQIAAELDMLTDDLKGGDREFAQSLTSWFSKKGQWSSKQLYWAKKLIRRAVVVDDEPEAVELGKFQKVYALFAHAKEHGSKYPKLKLQTKDGEPVGLAIAGARSKVPNVINVTDGKPFGQNKWYGRISQDGHWEMSKQYEQEELKSITGLLRELAKDPKGVVEAYGLMTGNCSCCGAELTDPKSIAIGIGPVCKKKWLG